jgi:hypothetical protein
MGLAVGNRSPPQHGDHSAIAFAGLVECAYFGFITPGKILTEASI